MRPQQITPVPRPDVPRTGHLAIAGLLLVVAAWIGVPLQMAVDDLLHSIGGADLFIAGLVCGLVAWPILVWARVRGERLADLGMALAGAGIACTVLILVTEGGMIAPGQ